MNNKFDKFNENKRENKNNDSLHIKKKYSKPQLKYYGGVKELTHSGTALGTGDSANPGTRRP